MFTDPPLLRRWTLPAEAGHELLVHEFGRADGIPALALHGGPGSGCSPSLARPFGATHYRVICLDQRGSGGSRPAGDIACNTTPLLLADLRLLRRTLGIERWLVMGGSWGASLAIAHAADEPQAVSGLLLRSSFLARPEDVHWFFHDAAAVHPAAWQALSEAVGHDDLLGTLAAWLHGDDATLQARAARAWRRWELVLAGQPPQALEGAALAAQVQRLRVQAHYLRHDCWLNDPPLLARCAALPAVPTMLLHARDDHVCRFEGALALRERLPHAQWFAGDEGGHDPTHPALLNATTAALERFATRGHFAP